MSEESKCPSTTPPASQQNQSGGGRTSCGWICCIQHFPGADPMDKDFDYAKAFASLDYTRPSKKRSGQADDGFPGWWPADFGHYGPPVHHA